MTSATTEAELADLRTRIQNAEGPDKELDMRICCAADGGQFFRLTTGGDAYLFRRVADGPIHRGERLPVTSSVDHGLRLTEKAFPGIWWFLARGKVSVEEPLYGAQLMFGEDVLGRGEHGANQAMALCAALVATLQMRLVPADLVAS